MSSINVSNFDTSKTDILKFDIGNCNSSYVNALRRIIMTEIDTVSFYNEDYETSSLKVLENISSLHNEFILHRLGLIPIKFKTIESYDVDRYKFVLDEHNKTSNIINITTKNIKIINTETNQEENNEDFFTTNAITGENILITRLKPAPDTNGEKIHIEGKSVIANGKKHAGFSPVSNVVFVNKQDPSKVGGALAQYLKEKLQKDGKDTKAILEKRFYIEEADRHFYTDDNDDPNMFEFTIESCGVMDPKDILLESVKQLINNIKNIKIELEKTFTDKDSRVDIKESTGLMQSYDITVLDESHTMGYLIQSYINNLYYEEGLFIGYMNPHPLEKKIIFRIKIKDMDLNKIRTIFDNTCDELIKLTEQVKKDILGELGITQEHKQGKAKKKPVFKVKKSGSK